MFPLNSQMPPNISGKEDKENKTTSITAQSTDIQYPSAKAVYDELQEKVDTNELTSALTSKADLVDGKIPSTQLPSYVDDVLEYNSFSDFPETGEIGKIYIDKTTNYTYRWSGTTYVQIGGQDYSEALATKLDANQGTSNANKYMKVAADGSVIYVNATNGVFIGTDTPTDDSIIWIDTDDDSSGFDDEPTQGSEKLVNSGVVYDALEDKQDKLTAGTNISIVNNVISASGGGGDKVETIVPDDYDTTKTYNINALCTYNNKQYQCNTNYTFGAWDSTKWDELYDSKTEVDYSKTEQKTGRKWIDGKDIYQKTYAGTPPTTDWFIVDTLSDISTMVKMEGMWGDLYSRPLQYYSTSTLHGESQFNTSSGVLQVKTNPKGAFFITIQYTKTTD